MPDLVRLSDPAGTSTAELAPERGALLTRFTVGGADILFLDQSTFDDATKNVRGGIPVLYPTPGKLAGDQWAYGGRQGSLPQHGFARNQPWQVVTVRKSTATVRLQSAGQARWPWPNVVELTFTVAARSLRIDQRVTNTGTEIMPFGLGFHPYFRVLDADKSKVRVETAARSAFDNVTKQIVEFDHIDLTAKEVDLHLIDHGASTGSLTWDGREIRLSASPEFTHWVVWTLAGRDFVCLEPWTSPGNGINVGQIRTVEPGHTESFFVELTYAE